MNSWQENNFLEKLLPPVKRTLATDLSACPDPATLSAVADGAANPRLEALVAGHMQRCIECASLYEQLCEFSHGELSAQEADWKNSQLRLDNWCQGFLQSKGNGRPSRMAAEKIAPRTPKTSIWRAWSPALIAAVILLAVGVYITRFGTITYPELALKPAPPPQTQAAPSASPNPAQSQLPEGSVATGDPARMSPLHKTRQRPHQVLLPDAEAKAEDQKLPADSVSANLPAETAANTPEVAMGQPADSLPLNASTSPASVPANSAAPDLANRRVTAEHTPVMRDVDITDGARHRPPSPARELSHNAASAPAPKIAHATTVVGSSFHLATGTRIWITVHSTTGARDANFFFRGSLLLPVTQNGADLLPRDTEVSGWGTAAKKQTSLVIREFVIGGEHYRLQNAGVPALAGKVNSLSFESGKTLEMWLLADSAYQRLPAVRPPAERSGTIRSNGTPAHDGTQTPRPSPRE